MRNKLNLILKCPVDHSAINESEISWEDAKPYKDIPTPKLYPIVGMIPNFLPGGRYFGLGLVPMMTKVREDLGEIFVFPGMMGKPDNVMTFDPNGIEKVLRNEGPWPYRLNFLTFHYFREKMRPDVFKNSGGLLAEYVLSYRILSDVINKFFIRFLFCVDKVKLGKILEPK